MYLKLSNERFWKNVDEEKTLGIILCPAVSADNGSSVH